MNDVLPPSDQIDPDHSDDLRTARRPSLGVLVIGLLIVSPAALPALTIWSNNVGLPKTYRLVVVVCLFTLLGCGIFWILRRVFSDARVAAFLTFVIVLALSSGGQILSESSWAWRWAASIVVVSLVSAIVLRLREWWLLDVLFIASATALLVPPLLIGLWTIVSRTESIPATAEIPLPIEMTDRPDIVLVILDGYTSLPVLREFFNFEDASLREDLESDGFEIVEPIFSGYSVTHFSLSSLLDLTYVAEERPTTTTEDGRTLAQVIGGDSRLVEILSSNGYRTTMVESGWHMSTCGEPVDVCVADPFIDEGVGAVLAHSLLWSFLEPSVGSAFTNGARHALRWTVDNIGVLVNNSVPDFLFVHVLVPHPPLLLDADCQIASDRRHLGGLYMAIAGASPETARIRLEGYANQVKCVNNFVRELADAFSGTDSLVFITGDHGSEAMAQLSTLPEHWSEPQILERMSVFLTVKAPPGCGAQSALVTVALFRSLVSCAGGLDLDPIDDKAFLISQDEIDGQQANMRVIEADQLMTLGSCFAVVDEQLHCP